LIAVVRVVGWLAAAGCASSTVVPEPPRVARLLVENLTDYAWHITVTAAAGSETGVAEVPARGFAEVTVGGGDYFIEQAARGAGAELSRRLPARLEAGQTYQWRLGTLLSDPAGPPPPTRP
jgi:hypothetical protein